MKDLKKLTRFQILMIIVFVIFKLVRPFILENDFVEIIKIIFLSLPNFFEGIVGMITLTTLGLYINYKWLTVSLKQKDRFIYLIALGVGEVYVVSQELGLHHLGGNNVFDPMDVVFSQIGLFTAFIVISYMKPTVYVEVRSS